MNLNDNYEWKKEYDKKEYDRTKIQKTLEEFVRSGKHFEQSGKMAALHYFGTTIKSRDLFNNIDLATSAFNNLGVKKDDIVFNILLNTPEMITALYAQNNSGAITEWFNFRGLTVDILRKYIIDNNIKYMIITDVVYDLVKESIKGTNIQKIIVNSITDSFDPITYSKYMLQIKGVPKLLNTNFAKKIMSNPNLAPDTLLARKIIELDHYSKKNKLDIKAAYHNDKNIDNKVFITWEEFLNFYGNINDINKVRYEEGRTTSIIHTGGTTGPFKRISISDTNINAFPYKADLMDFNNTYGDTLCQLVPPFVEWSIYGAHLARYNNMPTYLIPTYDKEEFVNIILKTKANHYFTVPSFVKKIETDPRIQNRDLSFIKGIFHGGEKIEKEKDEKIDEILMKNGSVPTTYGYGSNEGGACFVANKTGEGHIKKYGSCGVPLIGNELVLLDEKTKEVIEHGSNKIGLVHLKGDTVTTNGYYGEDAYLNEETFVDIEGEKYFNMQDLGRIDELGNFYFESRDSRMIRTQEGKVMSEALEEYIKVIDEVKDCCVVAAPHPEMDKAPACHILLQDDYYLLPEEKTKATFEKVINEIEEVVGKKALWQTYYFPQSYILEKEEFSLTPFGKTDFMKLQQENIEKYNHDNDGKTVKKLANRIYK